MRFPSLHKLHAQKYKTSLSHRFRQCNGKPGRWVIFHIPFFAVSARGATCGRQPAPGFPKFQFTPLREGRHQQGLARLWTRSISIHAPARGATWTTPSLIYTTSNFNSRPCERGDRAAREGGEHHLFQFTPLREGRPALYDYMAGDGTISIHAPARGATGPARRSRPTPQFQFTPLREGRQQLRLAAAVSPLFQFTPLREGRPTARQRATHCFLISIHAPARGATAKLNKICSVFSAIIEKNS